MENTEPIKLEQLLDIVDKFIISDNIIKKINNEILIDVQRSGLIHTVITFKELFGNLNHAQKEHLYRQIKKIYIEYSVTMRDWENIVIELKQE